MIVPRELSNVIEIEDFNSRLHITRYTECAPSKISTNVTDNLLIVILEGRKKLICGDYTLTLSRGEFGLFKKGNYIMNQILTSNLYESLLIFIPDNFLQEIKRLYNQKTVYGDCSNVMPYIYGTTGSYMQQEAEQLARLIKDGGNGYNEILKLKTKELLLYLLKGNPQGAVISFINSCLCRSDDINRYMGSNYTTCKGISDIAKDLNMSVSTFKRKFAEDFGTTPRQWINRKRLDKAMSLLETTDYPVTDICFLCGYESLPGFITCFKAAYGTSPGKLRKLKA